MNTCRSVSAIIGTTVLLYSCVPGGASTDSVQRYLRSVRSGDYSAAYSALCAETRSRIGETLFTERLVAYLDEHEGLRSYRVSKGSHSGRANYMIDLGDGRIFH